MIIGDISKMEEDPYFQELNEKYSMKPVVIRSREDLLLNVEILLQQTNLNGRQKKYYEKIFKNIIKKYVNRS